ncbi:uncharacterized protein [Montipora capricornis]|uniref:uncharacterized protein n=1 Tax=Montipora capricornis TaxID=246305 RepID=UPI0035F15314
MPSFRTKDGRPFETMGVDLAGPLEYKITKKELGKCYVLLFTCSISRAVYLEVTDGRRVSKKTELVKYQKDKTSEKASVFKATTSWVKKIRKSERLQDHLARECITWQINLSRSPWCTREGIYERLYKDVKKTLYKTLGRTIQSFEQLETVIIVVEKHLNNRPFVEYK